MKRKKTAVRVVLMYLILTAGMWMFLYSYANSHNRLSDEKILPAALRTYREGFVIEAMGKSVGVKNKLFLPESDFYFAAYMLAPIEVRVLCTAEGAWEKECGL